MKEKVDQINQRIENRSVDEILSILSDLFPKRVVFSTSFGFEDQVLSHYIFSAKRGIQVFTIDTGRLFKETYSVWNSTLEKYRGEIKVFSPNAEAVQNLVSSKGPFSFYESTENRKECCYVRKVEPLKRALKGNEIWITGIRAEQSGNRNDVPMVEWDEANQIIKVHPLLNWTLEGVKKVINEFNIPYNPLHDKGFVSIGCQPCTRAIQEGEDFRAGRWWWEESNKKECGLHVK